MSGGARYEIAIGGTPRTYRDTIEGAWAAATNLKMKQKRRHLPGKTVARDRPSSGGETLRTAVYRKSVGNVRFLTLQGQRLP
jgi:hypothetical protein